MSFSNLWISLRTLMSLVGTTVLGFLEAILARSFLIYVFPDTKYLSRVVALQSVLTALIAAALL